MTREGSLVLVVNPDPAACAGVRGALENAGFRVARCADAREAKEHAARYHPDAVVTAARLPDLDGRTLLHHLRESCPMTRGVILTGEDDAGEEEAKPSHDLALRGNVDPEELASAVARALEAREADLFSSDHQHDGALTGALASLIAHLRKRRYGDLREDIDRAIRGEANEFVEDLSRHLKYEEEILFPALAEMKPDQQAALDALQQEHRSFRDHARNLGIALREKDEKKASEVARGFLAALLEHIDRETAVIDGLIGPMDFRSAASLGRRLLQRRIKTGFRRKPGAPETPKS